MLISGSRLPLRFQGLQEHIVHYENRPVGRGGSIVPVAILKPDCWEPREMRNQDSRIQFTNDSTSAFVKKARLRRGHSIFPTTWWPLHEAGAYELNQCLSFNLIPPTYLVELPRPTFAKPPQNEAEKRLQQYWNTERIFGSIQEWVDGLTLSSTRFSTDNDWTDLLNNTERLYESYILTVLTYDPDRHKGNMIAKNNRLHFIDMSVFDANPYTRKLILPDEIIRKIRGTKLPETISQKLNAFIAHQSEYEKRLYPYYGKIGVKHIFQRARLLAAHPEVMELKEIRHAILRQQYPLLRWLPLLPP
jgi:hypothetical protein